jgi:hypothetical protein
MHRLRRRFRLPLLFSTLLVLLVSVACARPYTRRAPSGVVPARQVGFSGGGGLMWETDADLSRDLDTAASTGAKWIRLDVNWTGVEPTPGTFKWTYVDRAVNAIQSRGMQILMTLDYTPTWARKPTCLTSMFCPPAVPTTYAAFAGAAAARYGPRGIHAYEIWNEPNWAPWWIGAPDAPAYVALLNAAYPEIHRADPGATVVTGGLAPHGDLGANPSDPISPVNYLKAMYAAGAQGSFDAFGLHPYPPWPHATLSGKTGWNALLQTGIEHDIMVEHGDGAKPIWGTEYGAPTGSRDRKAVTDGDQAGYIDAGYRYWVSLDFAGPLFTHKLRDSVSTASDDWHAYMGVTRRDFSTKPALSTLRTLIKG